MDDEFDQWNKNKKDIETNKNRPLFHEREIWFISLGLNIGSEQNGKGSRFLRPIIIIKKFNNNIFWALPTTKKRRNGIYYYICEYKKGVSTTALVSQLRIFDGKRLQYKIGDITEIDFEEIRKRIISFLK